MKTLNQQSRCLGLTLGAISLAVLLGCSPEPDGHDHEAENGGHAPEQAQHADDEGHAEDSGTHVEQEDGHVELTKRQFESAGIEITSVVSSKVSESLTLTGAITGNADTVQHVTPRVSGQVSKVLKGLGDRVEKGELLCVIDSVALGEAVADYLRDRALLEAATTTLESERALFERRLAALTKLLDGAVTVQERIHARETELQQKAVSTIRPLLEAEKALQLAKLDKDGKTTELTAERDSRLLQLEVALRARRIDLTAAANRLRALGISSNDLAAIDDESPLLSGTLEIQASGEGVVVSRHVSNGEFVEAGSTLYVIEDLSDVWFIASAFEAQMSSLQIGQTASVSLDAFPGTLLSATVSFIDYQVESTSRSVGVRILLKNDVMSGWKEEFPLRPGMFGRAELETTSRQAGAVVPESALVHEDAGDYVFVQVEPFAFERRDVDVRPVAGGMVEVVSGLKAGESVAVSGTFLLKSAERQAELGGGHSH